MHVLKYCYIKNVTVCVNYTNFYTRAKRGEAEPSNNISERRMSKANEPVSEHSERASGYALGCMSSEWSEVLVYPEYTILFASCAYALPLSRLREPEKCQALLEKC